MEKKKANSKEGGVKSVQITIQQISGNPAAHSMLAHIYKEKKINLDGEKNLTICFYVTFYLKAIRI